MLLVKVLLASWRKQWQQILLVIFGLLTASAGLSSVLVLNETARQKMAQLDTPFSVKPKVIATFKNDKAVNKGVHNKDGFIKEQLKQKQFDKKAYAALLKRGLPVVGLAKIQLEFSGDKQAESATVDKKHAEHAELPPADVAAM